jgi:2-polyprenyl-6-hydroxyphenyl methylase/3-demethylubiquinone-9 3-methyltransferase
MTPRSLRPDVRDYFAAADTVSTWWWPDEGPMRFHYDAELAILDDHVPVPPGLRVLDVGTGRGRFGLHLAARGARVVGIDVSAEMVQAARERARAAALTDRFDARHGTAEDLSALPAASFDLVLCMEVFDHLPDLGPVLAETSRVMAPGARLVFTCVPAASLYGLAGDLYRWRRGRRDPAAVISRTHRLRDVHAALGRHGLALDRYLGIGLLCLSAQTRLFQRSFLVRAATALARAEAAVRPYYRTRWLARHAAHVVGIARRIRS